MGGLRDVVNWSRDMSQSCTLRFHNCLFCWKNLVFALKGKNLVNPDDEKKNLNAVFLL